MSAERSGPPQSLRDSRRRGPGCPLPLTAKCPAHRHAQEFARVMAGHPTRPALPLVFKLNPNRVLAPVRESRNKLPNALGHARCFCVQVKMPLPVSQPELVPHRR
jgi:hypothetical protein